MAIMIISIILPDMEHASDKIMPLSALPAGKTARIHSIENGAVEVVLMEMGCVPGAAVQMDRIAPLGDPVAIRIAGYSLAIRKRDADHILVEIS